MRATPAVETGRSAVDSAFPTNFNVPFLFLGRSALTGLMGVMVSALMLLGCDGLNGAAGADFFPSTPGYGVRYRCTDTHSSRDFDGDVWAVAQKEEVDPALNRSYGLIQTFADIGYAILAPGVGVVESSFTRGDGSLNSYVYQEAQEFGLNTISGTVTTDGTSPAESYVIALSSYNITSWDVTDSSGNFALGAYGPDVPVFFGVDNDGDSAIDYDNPTGDYPKRYTIRNVTGDRTGVTIDLSGI